MKSRWVPAGVFLVYLAWGLALCAPGILAGDSPELSASAFGWGISHPPGYPLWTLLAHLFTGLPLGSPAFRTTLASLVPTALSVSILGWILAKRVGPGPSGWAPGMGVALLVGTGPLWMAQATGTEVYGLHALILTCLLALTLDPSGKNFLAASFLVGLGLAHHHLILLVLPACAWAFRAEFRKPTQTLRALALFTAGLSLYLLLPLRAMAHPLADWGHPANWVQFWNHVSRHQYGGDLRPGSWIHGFRNAGFFWVSFFRDGWGGGGLLALGGLWFRRSKWRTDLPIALGLLGLGLGLPLLLRVHPDPENNSVMEAFLPPLLLWAAPWVLDGLQALAAKVTAVQPRRALTVLGAAILVARIGAGFTDSNASHNLAAEDMGRNFLLNLPRGAALYSEGDTATFPLAYLQQALGLRSDAEVFDRTGGLFRDLYGLLDGKQARFGDPDTLVAVERNRETAHPAQPIFYSEKETAPGRTLVPWGFLFLAQESNPPPLDEAGFWTRAREPRVDLHQDFLSRETGARFYVFRAVAGLRGRAALGKIQEDFRRTSELAWDNTRLLNNVGLETLRAGWVDNSAPYFEKSVAQDPDFGLGWYNLGIVARQQGRLREAEDQFKRCLAADPAYSPARDSWAILLFNSGRQPQAAEQWEILLGLDGTYAPAYRNLGFALATQDVSQSKRLLARYLQLAPGATDRAQVEALLYH